MSASQNFFVLIVRLATFKFDQPTHFKLTMYLYPRYNFHIDNKLQMYLIALQHLSPISLLGSASVSRHPLCGTTLETGLSRGIAVEKNSYSAF